MTHAVCAGKQSFITSVVSIKKNCIASQNNSHTKFYLQVYSQVNLSKSTSQISFQS